MDQERIIVALPCYGIRITSSGDGEADIISDLLEHDESQQIDYVEYNGYMHGIESLVLAHHCAGIDITTPAYIEGIETAVQAAANFFL